ncbi:PDR/VanB family oxidoreductase [Nesterenkonia sp. YGD6]|uniref:PDR/VanB family oxidoreductase n=1 Tax=Nesterenkonia sp. YGD6 TaxID=2901231 RepID=UPI001F4C9724|nr:PDR/VanB family oxidoreductase [Nesterenkonia sp. YGD6]MCH8563420.1 PDR/VanB family oxidoreductase [Nesterenkonia sp. YGD6]
MSTFALEVTDVVDASPEVRTLTLARPDRGWLPSFTPGSHLILECGPSVNAYSLHGDSQMPDAYTISVLRTGSAEGGSRWLHERRPGDTVLARPPRSLFPPMQKASKHLLVAAGIGVTPILSHLRAAVRWGHAVEVRYMHRPGHGVHLEELRNLAPGSLRSFTDRVQFRADLELCLQRQPIGTHLYCCGPATFMDAVREVAARRGWPLERVHTERFGADVLDPGKSFDVALSVSQKVITVAPGRSILEELEDQGLAVPNLCRQGFCGECRIDVTAGIPLHRDQYLEDEERAANDSLMCCVSRAASDRLEVPL